MKKSPTIFVIAFVLLTGLVLIPFVGVQGQAFRWQNYAGIYETPTPGPGGASLLIDFVAGQAGSFFTLTGFGYDPETQAAVRINGVSLESVGADSGGEVRFILDTGSADDGRYEVLVEQGGNSASAVFFLVPNGEIHPLNSEGTIIEVPVGIAELYEYLPVIDRE